MGVSSIGPIAVELFDPSFQWTGQPTDAGARPGTLSGLVVWRTAKQLVELAANAERRITLGDDTGVLEPVWFDDDLLRSFNGWYLLGQAGISPQYANSLGNDPIVPISVDMLLLGERQPVVVRSSRELVDANGLTGRELLAAPLVVDGATAFDVEPGGTVLVRDFDAVHGDDFFPAATDARSMQLRVANVGTLPSIVLPSIDESGSQSGSPPLFLDERGGDCRAYDIAEARAVYGPAHPLAEPSDLIIENGLLRVWVGGRGIVPYVSVAAFVDDAWAQCGCVTLASETTGPKLAGARLVRVTPDAVTAALRVATLGEIFLTLRRGERMIRVQHGDTTSPTIAANRRIGWLGTPPTFNGLFDGINGVGKFGDGFLTVSGSALFQWPAVATQDSWSIAGAWVPDDADSAQAASGLFTLLDPAFEILATAYWDDASSQIKVELSDDTLAGPAIAFDAGDVISWAVEFSTTAGLTLTVTTPTGTTSTTDLSINTPTSSEPIAYLALFGAARDNVLEWGDEDWGDGTWGGVYEPGGVIDEVIAFAGTLVDAAAITEAAHQLGDVVESRPVWYAAFDTDLTPTGGSVTSGRRLESIPDANGFTRVVASLDSVVADAGLGLAVATPTTSGRFLAGLATADTNDTGPDMQNQLAAASDQELRIR